MTLKVVFNNILVKVIEDKSAIVLSEEAGQPLRGEVVAIGGGTKDFPMQVRPTTVVYFNQSDARSLEFEGETYHILSQLDILGYEED